MAKVYHATQPVFGLYHKGTPKFPEQYDLVAEIEGVTLDKAYELTNHINCPWWDNDGVVTVKKSRSTSVGDVIVTEEGTFLCESIGWKKLEV